MGTTCHKSVNHILPKYQIKNGGRGAHYLKKKIVNFFSLS